MKLIGLSGKAEVGKNYVLDNYLRPLGYQEWSMAWPMKVAVVGRNMATHEEVFVTKPDHVRKLLQEEGTERGRLVYGENYWCDLTAEWLRLLEEKWGVTKVCLPDIRFPNEVELVHNLGGVVLRIIAPERVRSSRLTPLQRQHASETSLDSYLGFDGYINNNPGEEDVGVQVYRQLRRLGFVETVLTAAA